MKTQREKVLAIATAVIAIFAVFFYSGGVDMLGSVGALIGGQGDELKQEMDEAQRVQEILSRRPEVEALYAKKVRQNLPTGKNKKPPEDLFSEEIYAACRNASINLSIDPPKREPIPDVEDYEFIVVDVKYSQEWPEVVRVLKFFEDNFYLVKELSVNAPLDLPINVTARLARVVPLTAAEKKQRLEDAKKHRRTRSSTGAARS